ncbi:MAG: pyridoxamine 5'-phosphate oxidase family protein [Tepidiformaceae bacterium]
MPPLTRKERSELFDTPGVLCRIATLRPDGAPTVTPAWFVVSGARILVTPRAHSAWLANLRRDSRVSITIDEEAAPYRKVRAEGHVEIVHDLGKDDVWRDLYRQITRRYVSAEAADAYIDETIDQPRALLALDLETANVTTWRMPLAGESYTGIWHRRYYVPGSKMAAQVGSAPPEDS